MAENTKSIKKPFTLDSDQSNSVDMPSVSKLLNRKSLNLLKASQTKSQAKLKAQAAEKVAAEKSTTDIRRPPASKKAAAPAEIELSAQNFDEPTPEIQSSHSQQARAQIQTAGKRRGGASAAERPKIWDLATLKSSGDPLGAGIIQLMNQGATTALFLAIQAKPGSNEPIFLASAAVAGTDRLDLWTGLKWDPKIVPEIWNHFIQGGHAELTPPGTVTNLHSTRNALRAAFGVGADEWLLLIRTGPVQACRGVLAVISKVSLSGALSTVLPLVTAPIPRGM